jgi:hypothetical protein
LLHYDQKWSSWQPADYARVRAPVAEAGGAIAGEEYFPLDHMDYDVLVDRIRASSADVVFNTTFPPVLIGALDHARIPEGPGGPAEMVPGQHHARLHMYIAQARSGRFEVVKSLGAIDPKEQLVEPAIL